MPRQRYVEASLSTKVEIHISAQASPVIVESIVSTKVEIHISAQAKEEQDDRCEIYQSRNSYQCPGTRPIRG